MAEHTQQNRGLPFTLRTLALLAGCTLMGAQLHGQAATTASRDADLQIGGSFAVANSNYNPNYLPALAKYWKGYGLYATYDFRPHLGIEVDFRQVNTHLNADQTPIAQAVDAYQRDYEIGGRYVRHFGILNPYGKGMYGRAVMNFPEGVANLAYNQLIAGAGVDVNVRKHINVRLDYEFHHYFSFPDSQESRGLSPQVFSVGAAYHF